MLDRDHNAAINILAKALGSPLLIPLINDAVERSLTAGNDASASTAPPSASRAEVSPATPLDERRSSTGGQSGTGPLGLQVG